MEPEDYTTIRAAAENLGVSRSTVRSWIAKHGIEPAANLPGLPHLYRWQDLIDAAKSQHGSNRQSAYGKRARRVGDR